MICKRNHAKLAATAALAVSVLAGSAVPSYADAPKARVSQHFSFADKRPSFRQEGTTKSDVAVSSIDSEGLLTLQDEIWYPTFAVTPHFHKTHHETFYVVSGRVEWTVGGETHAMSAGDSVHIPANTVHSVKVLDGKNAHMLMIYSPGGYEEHMAREEAYTLEQLKDPKLRDQLRDQNDFHPVEDKK
jgi:mannose-6-phosphate isomerase-like protein (cupin superfamily)